jgi:hypothetical protein
MSSHLADDADHWRKRAEELRQLAEIMSNEQSEAEGNGSAARGGL